MTSILRRREMRKVKKTLQLMLCTAAITVGTYGATNAQNASDDLIVNTLKEAVITGMKTNPETGVVENNRRATDEELRQAQALYYPSIDVVGDTGYQYSDNISTQNRLFDDDDEVLYKYQIGVTLTQMLFDGFETQYENSRQYWRVRSASHRVRETAEFVGLDIIEAYLDVVRQRELLRIAQSNVQQHLDIMGQIEDGAEAGRSTDADLEQVRARLAAARANEANVIEALRVSEAAYKQQVGDLPGDLEVPTVPVDAVEADVETEVKHAITHSPTLDIFEADVNVAEMERRQTRSTYYPQVDLELNAATGENNNGIEATDKNASALLVLNWNLFRGGGDVARERELIYRHAQAKEQRNDTSRAIENDVRTTWASMISAGERARQFSAQAAANEQVVNAYKDQFDLDRRTLLDVLDAQNELFVSRSNTINNEVLEMFAVYRLLALKGELMPTLDVAYQAEVDPDDNY
ncbi:MAG: type I secretion protein TolC [Alphaproteobacteria bacterium]|nr:type I secretion protein TolC [Alphaproteobacteria bacterium]